jgi:subtilisin family serine protease
MRFLPKSIIYVSSLSVLLLTAEWFMSDSDSIETKPIQLLHQPASVIQNNAHKPSSAAASSQLPKIPFRSEIPAILKSVQLIAEDAHISPNGIIETRRVLQTGNSVGKVLLIDTVDNEKLIDRKLYSAEHIIVSAEDTESLLSLYEKLTSHGLEVIKPFSHSNILYVTLNNETPAHIMDMLETVSSCVGTRGFVELDGVCSIDAIPTDPLYGTEWHHQKIQSEEAWDITQGNSSVIVAVLDTGITKALIEFGGRLLAGYDFSNDDSNPTDDNGHGTAVASVIAANANNDLSIAGVDWNCRILPIKILGSDGTGLYSKQMAGIEFAIKEGASVINLSAGGSTSSPTLTQIIYKAIYDGCIFVAAAGNEGIGTLSFPGSLSQCITVGATDTSDVKSSFSNWGSNLDLVAPGNGIAVLSTTGTVSYSSGTSFSTPQVSAAAALLLSVDPALDQTSLGNLLKAGAEDQLGATLDVKGFDNYYGWGRLNVYNSLLLLKTTPTLTRADSDNTQMSWEIPDNAESKSPYQIRYSSNLTSWTTLTAPKITYYANQATWIDDGSETGSIPISAQRRFYRVRIEP